MIHLFSYLIDYVFAHIIHSIVYLFFVIYHISYYIIMQLNLNNLQTLFAIAILTLFLSYVSQTI